MFGVLVPSTRKSCCSLTLHPQSRRQRPSPSYWARLWGWALCKAGLQIHAAIIHYISFTRKEPLPRPPYPNSDVGGTIILTTKIKTLYNLHNKYILMPTITFHPTASHALRSRTAMRKMLSITKHYHKHPHLRSAQLRRKHTHATP